MPAVSGDSIAKGTMRLLDNESVHLRRPEPADIEMMYRYRNDPQIVASLGYFSRGFARADIADWIESHRKNQEDLVWTISDRDDRCIGHCGLYKINPRNGVAAIGICIGDESFRSKGVGKMILCRMIEYAFQQLNLRKIRAEVLASNQPARNLFTKLGFETEAILREYKYRNWQYLDLHILGLFRSQWQAGQAPWRSQ